MLSHEYFMKRCFDLARNGADLASPNPMVGAVIVHKGRIIGEGFHRKYGQAHAEVNAVASVSKADKKFLKESTIYVSLEPCCIHGNTPPCTELIFKHKIPHVVVGYIDKYLGDNGKSINILRNRGVKVTTSVLADYSKKLSKIRDTYTQKHRPYIILKFAESQNGYIGSEGQQVWLSNPYSKRLVHKWRSEVDTILVGTNTVKTDNPRLTNRLYFSKSPTRIILDKELSLNRRMKVWDATIDTFFVTEKKLDTINKTGFIQLDFDEKMLNKMLEQLYERKFSSLLVEGGATTLQHFIDQNLWDEIRVLRSPKTIEAGGIPSPKFSAQLLTKHRIADDELLIYQNAS